MHQEIKELKDLQSKLGLVTNELKEWSATAYWQLYETLNQCFHKRQLLTGDLVLLPLNLNTLVEDVGYTPALWESYYKRGLAEVGTLSIKYHERDTVARIAESIYLLLKQSPPELTAISPTEDAISKKIKAFEIQSLRPVPALEKLHQLAQQTLEQINRPFHYLWDYNTETLRSHSRLYCAAAKIKVIGRQASIMVQGAKPSAIEPALRRIADETISSIVTNVQIG